MIIATLKRKLPSTRTGAPALCVPLLLPLLCLSSSAAQESKPAGATQNRKFIEAPVRIASTPYRSGGRRDPFLNPLLLKKNVKNEDEEIARGAPPSGIAGTYIAQAVLQGTSIRDKGRIAIIRGADARAYFMREGDRLFDGYVKTITTDSVTLVRETKMKSGKVLTQEVTKRLRTQ